MNIQPNADRVVFLDVLRGFALFGIYIAIIHSFNNAPWYGEEIFSKYSSIDKFVDVWNVLLITKRFIAIFSLLFGIGIAIQLKRFMEKGENFNVYFVKRMFILAILGLINTTFFFWGEILLTYAVFGLIVLSISKINYRLQLIIAFVFFAFWHPLFEIFFYQNLIIKFDFYPELYPFEKIKEIYTSGTLLEMAKNRWIEYLKLLVNNSAYMGTSISMIIVGFVIGKKEFHITFLKDLKKWLPVATPAILITFGCTTFGYISGNLEVSMYAGPWIYSFYLVFLLASTFSYIYVLAALYKKFGSSIFFKTLANNGRMSLTGYMGAACIYSFIFHNNGLGLYLKYGAFGQTLIAIFCYLSLSIFSTFWFKKRKYGPMEWIYRRCAYGKI